MAIPRLSFSAIVNHRYTHHHRSFHRQSTHRCNLSNRLCQRLAMIMKVVRIALRHLVLLSRRHNRSRHSAFTRRSRRLPSLFIHLPVQAHIRLSSPNIDSYTRIWQQTRRLPVMLRLVRVQYRSGTCFRGPPRIQVITKTYSMWMHMGIGQCRLGSWAGSSGSSTPFEPYRL